MKNMIWLAAALCAIVAADTSRAQAVSERAATPTFHVFLLLGQSNMAGFEKAIAEDKSVDPRIRALGFDDCPAAERTEGTWSVAIPPLHECWNGALGPGDSFAAAMLKTYAEGDTIGLVPLALSGQPVERFMKGVPESRYEWILARAKAALEAGGVIEGMLYHQGESNCGQADWPQKVATFVTDLRNDLGLGDGVPFLIGELLHSGDCARHNPLVHEVPQHLANAHVVSAEGLEMAARDPWRVHFSRAAEVELGRRYADALLTLTKRSTPP